MASTRCIKRKIAEVQEQFQKEAPQLAAWSSVETLSSSEIPKLSQLQMSGSEIEEAGVSPYSYSDPSELPAKMKLLASLPELEKELNQVQLQFEQKNKMKMSELHSPWKLEFVLAFGALLAAGLSCVPQQVQFGVVASSVVVLASWLGSLGVALSQQLKVLTEVQLEQLLQMKELQLKMGWSYTCLRKVEFSLVYREGNVVKLLLQIFDKLGYVEKRCTISHTLYTHIVILYS